MKAEQDGELPDLSSAGQSAEERNMVKELYNDEQFRMEKALAEAQIQKASAITSESKNFLSEMDDFLKDLEGWKK